MHHHIHLPHLRQHPLHGSGQRWAIGQIQHLHVRLFPRLRRKTCHHLLQRSAIAGRNHHPSTSRGPGCSGSLPDAAARPRDPHHLPSLHHITDI
jgi:hypothetical protein